MTFGGRQIDMPRLRARSDQGELSLSSFQWAATKDPLNAHTIEAVAAGVSTRQYARGVRNFVCEPVWFIV